MPAKTSTGRQACASLQMPAPIPPLQASVSRVSLPLLAAPQALAGPSPSLVHLQQQPDLRWGQLLSPLPWLPAELSSSAVSQVRQSSSWGRALPPGRQGRGVQATACCGVLAAALSATWQKGRTTTASQSSSRGVRDITARGVSLTSS